MSEAPVSSQTRDGAGAIAAALQGFAAQLGAGTPADAMRRACADVLARTGCGTGVASLDAILNVAGARCLVSRGAQRAGLSVTSDGYLITVQPGYLRKNNFPVAHEVGHILLFEHLGHDRAALRALAHATADREVERLCDLAAAELLMPVADFAEQALNTALSYRRLHEMSSRYACSIESILVRLTELVPGVATARFKRARGTSAEARAYDVVAFGRTLGLSLPKRLGERAFSPNLFERARRLSRSASRKVTVARRPWKPLHVAALMMISDQPASRQEPTLLLDLERRLAPPREPEYIMLFRHVEQPLPEWEVLTGPERKV